MGLNFLKNKKVVFLLLLFLFFLLLIGGFLIWFILGPAKGNDFECVDLSEYEIKKTEEGTIIENKKQGLAFKVPDGWIIKKNKYSEKENEILLFDPNVEFDENGKVLVEKSFKEKGACSIGITIIKYIKRDSDIPTDAEIVSNYIKAVKDGYMLEKDGYALAIIDGKEALRITNQSNDKTKILTYVQLPLGQTIYNFGTGIVFNEKCIEKFNEFLKGVSINK